MASSAFKSTTRRTLHGTAERPAPSQPHCPRRSRSVTPAPRSDRLLGDFSGTTRTNPLFDRRGTGASPTPPPPVSAEERGRKESKGRGSGRARSVSVAPPQRRRAAASAPSSAETDGGGGDRAPRARSVADDARPGLSSEVGDFVL